MVGGYHYDGAGGYSGGAPERLMVFSQNGVSGTASNLSSGFGGSYFSNSEGRSLTDKKMLTIGGARWRNMWTRMGYALL